MKRLAAIGIVLAGCAGDSAIDLTLRLPADDVDLSCVRGFRVYAWGENVTDTPPNQCIVLDHEITGGFADLERAVKGKLALTLPISGLAGIDVSGMTYDDCFGEAVVYGGAEYDGGDMEIPLQAGFDCSIRSELVVRPLDYQSMIAHTCAGGSSRIDRGSIHPTMLDYPLPSMVYDLTEPSALVSIGGLATFPDAMLSIDDDSCLAIGDDLTGSISCVHPGSPGMCSTGAEVELTTIDIDFANASMNGDAAEAHTQVVFGSVWDVSTPTKTPIAGARVTIADADADVGEIHYARLPVGGAQLVDIEGAQATDAGGLFVAYMDRPITVTVTAPGYLGREMKLTAADYVFGAETIVLRK